MRRAKELIVGLTVVIAVLATAASAAFAGTITSPTGTTGSPYAVPGDSKGVPLSFSISFTGFAAHTQVYVEQCDGVVPTAPKYEVTSHCDLGSSPSAVVTDSSGAGTFPKDDPNFGFTPFKGMSPQGIFNCLSPTQADPDDGVPSWRNCQVRVSTNNTSVTGDQAYLPITLPEVSTPKVPAAPTGVTATAGNATVTVSWTAPLANPAVSGYVVTPYVGTTAQTPTPFTDPLTSHRISGLTNGTTYTFKVAAKNSVGTGAQSAPSPAVTPSAPPWAPFASADAFTTRQFHDLAARTPTASERSSWSAALTNHTKTAAQLIDSLRTAAYWEPTEAPVIRLYSAFFLRTPDTGGITHWIGAYRNGTSLASIASAFASSSEFKNRYGPLTNAQFVDLVYQNVLGRPPDASGRAYWVKKLDQGTSRGTVMIGFSNSQEYTNKQAANVAVIDTYLGLLRRAPTPTEASNAVSRVKAGTPITTIITEILASGAYAASV
ncbi:MAG: hypothetical protein JWN46_1844 [Acidimicrobiales bacterium]|nr:hypothetical protein [Acidimicrobiales bacterium]